MLDGRIRYAKHRGTPALKAFWKPSITPSSGLRKSLPRQNRKCLIILHYIIQRMSTDLAKIRAYPVNSSHHHSELIPRSLISMAVNLRSFDDLDGL